MTDVIFYKLIGIELVLRSLSLTRLDLTKDFFSTLSSLIFLTNSVVVITEFLNSNHFQYQ